MDDKISIEPKAVASSATDSPALLADLDDNYDLYNKNGELEVDPAEAKKVLRKIDRHARHDRA